MESEPMRFWVFVAVSLAVFLSSPAIHVAFPLFLGWHEYMPFIRVPYLLGSTA